MTGPGGSPPERRGPEPTVPTGSVPGAGLGSVILRLPGEPHTFEVGRLGAAGSVGAELVNAGGYYESGLLDALRRTVPGDGVALDIGANIGLVSLALGHYCPQGSIYAFEPAAETFAQLRDNLRRNQASNVAALKLATWDRAGTITLSYTPGNAGGAFIASTGVADGVAETVDMVRVDDWVSGQGLARLDVIKLDVEGAELRTLQGARTTIDRFRPDLLVEVNPLALGRFGGESSVGLLRLLRELYPSVGYLRHDGRTVEIAGERHLELLLRGNGLIMAHATFSPRAPAVAGDGRGGRPGGRLAPMARSLGDRIHHELAYNRFRCPDQNFVVTPDCRIEVSPPRLTGRPGQQITVSLSLRNTGSSWWSSTFPANPVVASYRILDAHGAVYQPDGVRSPLPHPVRPGGTVTVPLTVHLPDDAGEYRLVVSLIQEAFAWFCDVVAGAGLEVPAVVTDAAR